MPERLEGLLQTQPDAVDDVAMRIVGLAQNMRKQMDELEIRLRNLSNNAGGQYAESWEQTQRRINRLQDSMDAKMGEAGQLIGQMSGNNRRTDNETALEFKK
ncbi:hypothetical protein ABT337_25470 [Saccharopolyspora hirsuta]|uniref:WXG100 family type VII secretion target n=1 Tax=Saccharopolyspora hirsuta TaxID=1837 RepID=A0A5M7BH99_SACHI|nr:hypothetical protein [Saccharopolyspora hirsuta]KAA5829166.1 hypothetical protein F1721_26225 [Saccharopolyspora hirsuta]